jgi:hypothetical protein
MIGLRSDASKVLLGCPRRGPETVGVFPHSGSAVGPSIAGCINSSGEFVAGAANPVIGISRGQSLTHDDMNSVTQKGKEVPLRLTDYAVAAALVVGNLTFTAKVAGAAGNSITIALVGGATAGSETVEVDETDIVINIESEVSTATQIKAALEASVEASELVSVEIEEGEGSTAQAAAAAANLAGGEDPYTYVVEGAVVYVHDTTGFAVKSDDADAVATNWHYDSGVLDGVSPSGGSDVKVALVNM